LKKNDKPVQIVVLKHQTSYIPIDEKTKSRIPDNMDMQDDVLYIRLLGMTALL